MLTGIQLKHEDGNVRMKFTRCSGLGINYWKARAALKVNSDVRWRWGDSDWLKWAECPNYTPKCRYCGFDWQAFLHLVNHLDCWCCIHHFSIGCTAEQYNISNGLKLKLSKENIYLKKCSSLSLSPGLL